MGGLEFGLLRESGLLQTSHSTRLGERLYAGYKTYSKTCLFMFSPEDKNINANICLHTVRFDDSHNAMTMCT